MHPTVMEIKKKKIKGKLSYCMTWNNWSQRGKRTEPSGISLKTSNSSSLCFIQTWFSCQN